MWIDSLVPVWRRGLKSSQVENYVQQLDLIEEEDMLRDATLTFLNIFEFIFLRGPVWTRTYLSICLPTSNLLSATNQ